MTCWRRLRDWTEAGVWPRLHELLLALTRLWAFDQLSARPCRIGRPPWEDRGIDDYLPAATTTGGENSTEPLSEHTMGPLLVWALRMVEDLGGDILAAEAERRRLTQAARTAASSTAGAAALRADLPAAVLADLLGLHVNTAVRWVTYARRDWTDYLALRAQHAGRCITPG
ncbi:hypothetical protein FHX81_0419 [Saccharothrix saharensis]|uniref:Uncharacterized protein n=1 Tax=Saccharothrix saharensis TaxID=571190 RepID=A0A543J5N5_9PSEU|nr:hypothetical protein FHX81_0419 [Saccharothrix saharensis]